MRLFRWFSVVAVAIMLAGTPAGHAQETSLEPICTSELPEGSACWQELTARSGCYIWIPYLAYSVVYTTWSGDCAGGIAEGEGRLGKTMGDSFHTDRSAAFAAGKVIEMGEFVVVDSPSDDSRPTDVQPTTDTPREAGPSGSGPLHGSIAFSQDDDGAYAWGIAWSFDSSAGAQSEALGQCREYGGTRCAEAGWFQEACGALAIGDGNGYGTGWGATTGEAERDALSQCRVSNDDCRIEVARCAQSEQAGGAGRTDSEDTVVGREPADTSDDSCGWWAATYTVTWNEEGIRRGGINFTEESGVHDTRAVAEDRARDECTSKWNVWPDAVQSCDVEVKCVD